jgi:hypothetical protein
MQIPTSRSRLRAGRGGRWDRRLARCPEAHTPGVVADSYILFDRVLWKRGLRWRSIGFLALGPTFPSPRPANRRCSIHMTLQRNFSCVYLLSLVSHSFTHPDHNMPLDLGTVLVTGATGLVGSHIVVALCKRGFKVNATSRTEARAKAWSVTHPEFPVNWFVVKDQKKVGVYDEAMVGCVGAVQAAGPFNYDHKVSKRSSPL